MSEAKSETFEYNGIFYIIEQDKYEVREMFLERVWFILSKINTGKSFDELCVLSRMWINEISMNCKYLNSNT